MRGAKWPAVDELLDQDAAGRQVAIDPRNAQRTVSRSDRSNVLRLHAEVELLTQVLGKAARERDRADPPGPGALLKRGGQAEQDVQVSVDQPLDLGPLDLDDDLGAARESCPVHLSDRGRRQRPLVELDKHLIRKRPELAADHLAHRLRRHWRDVVLQA